MKPLADQDWTMSNVLFLDQSERIEFGYFTHNLTNKWFIPSFQREKLISTIINFLIKADFQASVKIIMIPRAKVVKLNSEKKKAPNLRTIYRTRSFKLIHK